MAEDRNKVTVTRRGKRTVIERISSTVESPSKKKRACQSRKGTLELNTSDLSEKKGDDAYGFVIRKDGPSASAIDTCSSGAANTSVSVASEDSGVVRNGTGKGKLKKSRKKTATVSQNPEIGDTDTSDSSLEPLQSRPSKGKQSTKGCKISKVSACVSKENSTCNKGVAINKKTTSTSKSDSSSPRKLTKKAMVATVESLSDAEFLQFTLPRMFKLLSPGEYLWKRCERKKDHKVVSSAIVFSQFSQLRNLVQKRLRKVLQEEKEVMAPNYEDNRRLIVPATIQNCSANTGDNVASHLVTVPVQSNDVSETIPTIATPFQSTETCLNLASSNDIYCKPTTSTVLFSQISSSAVMMPKTAGVCTDGLSTCTSNILTTDTCSSINSTTAGITEAISRKAIIPSKADCTTSDVSAIPTLKSTVQSVSSHFGVLGAQPNASASTVPSSFSTTSTSAVGTVSTSSIPITVAVSSSPNSPRCAGQPVNSSTCLLPQLFISPKPKPTSTNQVPVVPIPYAVEINGKLEPKVMYFNPSGYNNKKAKPSPIVSEEEVLRFLENRPKEAAKLVLKAKDIWKTSLLAGHILPLFFQRNPEPFEDFSVQLALKCSLTYLELKKLKLDIGKKLHSATGINVIVDSQKVFTHISVVRREKEQQNKVKAKETAMRDYQHRIFEISKAAEERALREYQMRLQIQNDTEVLKKFMKGQCVQSQDTTVGISEELGSSDDTDDEGLTLDRLLLRAVTSPKGLLVHSQDAGVRVSEELGSTDNTGLTLNGLSPRTVISPDKIKTEPCSDDETSPPTLSIMKAMEEMASEPSNADCCLIKCKREPADSTEPSWY